MPNALRILVSVAIGVVAVIYDADPIDLIPDYITGPVGSVDDIVVTIGAIAGIVALIVNRKKKRS